MNKRLLKRKIRLFAIQSLGMTALQQLMDGIKTGDFRQLARALTLVENDIDPSMEILRSIQVNHDMPVFGITGPPGAGKSTLVNAITTHLVSLGKKVAILAVDPTSPFNFGSLLGDRIRMAAQFNNPNVYIRSIATRGALGGVSVKTMEMVDVLRSSTFDLVIVETVGVGQSEVEIAGLADLTAVVLVPESGDEIQNIKSGLMEIAQAFVVNKADREGAAVFANNLKKLVSEQHQQIPVFKTVADKNQGVIELCDWIINSNVHLGKRRIYLLAEKAYRLIQHQRMRDVDKAKLLNDLNGAWSANGFNLYQFVERWTKHS